MTFWDYFIPSIIGALVGGGLTGTAALLAARNAHKYNLEIQEQNQQRILKAYFQAIHDEIETLWDHYRDSVGSQIESLPKDQPFLFYYPLTQGYFTVYTGNASLLGHIDDNDLRKAIVTTYTKARAMVDSYRMNNDLLHQWEHWVDIARGTNIPIHIARADACFKGLIEYASSLKETHED